MRAPKRGPKRLTGKFRPSGPASRPGRDSQVPDHPGPKPSSRPGYKPRDLGSINLPRPRPVRPGKPDPALMNPGPADRSASSSAGSRREVSHVVSLDKLAASTAEIAFAVEKGVLGEGRRADRAIAIELRRRRDLSAPDCRFISQAIFALFRWKGWVDTLREPKIEARLLFSWMLDSPRPHPACRLWARSIGLDADKMLAVGEAPNWTARGDGWKRLNSDRTLSADPWQLFPQWLREHLPLPPGGGSPKMKWLELLQSLQARPPLWVRVQGLDEKAIWAELTAQGIKPWHHRKLKRAAKIGAEADVHHLEAFERGDLEIQDLASQAVGLACDPEPGERWWDVCAGAGGKSLHLSSLMEGKGVVIASDIHEGRLKETARRARRSPFRNLSTKLWDGKHVVGKAGRYDGVLVDAPCSAIGTWRRNPDARWTLKADAVARLAAMQAQILRVGASGVKPGGTLVYSVCTLTIAETQGVLQAFLAEHPQFRLDPFPHPISGEPTDGIVQVWPQDADTDAMFIARMVRTGAPSAPTRKPKKVEVGEPSLRTIIGNDDEDDLPRDSVVGDPSTDLMAASPDEVSPTDQPMIEGGSPSDLDDLDPK